MLAPRRNLQQHQPLINCFFPCCLTFNTQLRVGYPRTEDALCQPKNNSASGQQLRPINVQLRCRLLWDTGNKPSIFKEHVLGRLYHVKQSKPKFVINVPSVMHSINEHALPASSPFVSPQVTLPDSDLILRLTCRQFDVECDFLTQSISTSRSNGGRPDSTSPRLIAKRKKSSSLDFESGHEMLLCRQ